VKWLNLNIQAW